MSESDYSLSYGSEPSASPDTRCPSRRAHQNARAVASTASVFHAYSWVEMLVGMWSWKGALGLDGVTAAGPDSLQPGPQRVSKVSRKECLSEAMTRGTAVQAAGDHKQAKGTRRAVRGAPQPDSEGQQAEGQPPRGQPRQRGAAAAPVAVAPAARRQPRQPRRGQPRQRAAAAAPVAVAPAARCQDRCCRSAAGLRGRGRADQRQSGSTGPGNAPLGRPRPAPRPRLAAAVGLGAAAGAVAALLGRPRPAPRPLPAAAVGLGAAVLPLAVLPSRAAALLGRLGACLWLACGLLRPALRCHVSWLLTSTPSVTLCSLSGGRAADCRAQQL